MIELSAFVGPLISAICAFAGSWLAFSTRLARVETKLEVIEAKQDKHNKVIERVYKLENAISYMDNNLERIQKDINHYHR